MRYILFILFFLPILTIGQDNVKFIAGGVTCSSCSNAIYKSLQSDKKILKIESNLETQEWDLKYKTGDFKIEDLKKLVEDAGFSIYKLWVNNELILNKKTKIKK
jgi:copper chaperone CopZ